jgi:hypothetical protein
MVHVLDDAVFQRCAHTQVVEDGEVLNVFAEAHASGVRANRNAEFRRHQEDRQDLVDAAQAAGVDLTEVDGPGLHHLLEDHPVLALFAGSDADRRDGSRDGCVAEHVVWAGGLFDPMGIKPGQLTHVGDGLPDIPPLVCVHHEFPVRADFLPDQGAPPEVVLQAPTHLHLEVGPPGLDPLPTEATDLFI